MSNPKKGTLTLTQTQCARKEGYGGSFSIWEAHRKAENGRLTLIGWLEAEYEEEGRHRVIEYRVVSLNSEDDYTFFRTRAEAMSHLRSITPIWAETETETETGSVSDVEMNTGEQLEAVQGEMFTLGEVEIDNQGNVGYLLRLTKKQKNLVREYRDCKKSSSNPATPNYLREGVQMRAEDIVNLLVKSGISRQRILNLK